MFKVTSPNRSDESYKRMLFCELLREWCLVNRKGACAVGRLVDGLTGYASIGQILYTYLITNVLSQLDNWRSHYGLTYL